MRTDYHMHPMITQKPERFDEFAHRAIEVGIEEVCITDHMPLSISDTADRIPAGKVREYCRNVREAAERYDVMAAIEGKEQQLITHEEMMRVMKLMEAVIESGENNVVITDFEKR